jgi:predicted RNase H-like HicB family nuclease
MPKSRSYTAVLTREPGWWVGHCLELGVVSQGKSIEEAQDNLKEAVELYLESFGSEDEPAAAEFLLYPLEVPVGA